MEQKEKGQTAGEGLLLLSFLLMMSGLGFIDQDETRVSKQEVIGMCLSGAGFLMIVLMMFYFLYKTLKKK